MWRSGDTVPSREAHIHNHSASIAFGNQLCKLRHERGSRLAGFGHGGDIVRKGTPVCPDANPVESRKLHIIQIAPNEILGRTQSAVVTDPQEELYLAIDREAGAFDAERGGRRFLREARCEGSPSDEKDRKKE